MSGFAFLMDRVHDPVFVDRLMPRDKAPRAHEQPR